MHALQACIAPAIMDVTAASRVYNAAFQRFELQWDNDDKSITFSKVCLLTSTSPKANISSLTKGHRKFHLRVPSSHIIHQLSRQREQQSLNSSQESLVAIMHVVTPVPWLATCCKHCRGYNEGRHKYPHTCKHIALPTCRSTPGNICENPQASVQKLHQACRDRTPAAIPPCLTAFAGLKAQRKACIATVVDFYHVDALQRCTCTYTNMRFRQNRSVWWACSNSTSTLHDQLPC